MPVSASATTFSGDNAYNHVKELAGTIGIRAAGTAGERKAGDYIENYFKQLGLATERPPVEFTTTRDNGSAFTYQDKNGQNVVLKGNALNLSGNGKLSAPLSYAGLGLDGQIPSGSLQGKIALVQRGQISFSEKVDNAVAAGAIGVVIFNSEDGPLNSATLSKPASVPVLGLSKTDGENLRDTIKAGTNISGELNVNITNTTLKMTNVLGLQPAVAVRENAPILIIGGHYDSVPAGPGANDNASGTAVMMELARVLKDRYPRYEIRYLGFAGEEIGLAGSSEYVRTLSPAERQRIVAMINIDMISVGPQFLVGGTPELTQMGMNAAMAEGAGDVQVMPSRLAAASDHYPFQEAGIKVLFFNRQDDVNYHKPGDTPDKVQPERLAQTGRIVMKVIDGLLKN
jgi:aminopeptidase YwaD